MEHTATCASKNRVSRFAVLLADFCNKIGTSRTREMFALSLQSVPKQRLIGQDTTMGDRHRGRPRPMMPLERTGAFTIYAN